ncbi:MAG: S8 family peptidase [Bacteroides sp.]|jgi:subtilisin family serine protease|nr:S8 family peptidase [Bacteroides sp.]
MSGKIKSFLICFLLAGWFLPAWSGPPSILIEKRDRAEGDYLEGQMIFKIKPELAAVAKTHQIDHPLFKSWATRYQATGLKKIFPTHQPPAQKYNQRGEPLTDLSRIYHLELGDGQGLWEAIDALYATGLVEYAEPKVLPSLLYVPDDPMIGSQYSLERIKAFDAWDISKGDTTVVIAIVDTGNDRFHPDLINAIAYNYNDTINGEDSDNDGFVDNFYGWDLALNNNDPQYSYSGHGVHVAGIAAASADNGTGIAGTGYHSRFMTVKIDDELGRLIMSYEGIVYAADRGASVINCSWGGTSGAGQYGQDIVNYATFNRDALVVAAAGNDNNQIPFYPATYENVLSVAATNSSDLKWSGSSYNVFVDLSAPGATILSTFVNATYITSSGTSMATPAVAGAAAILRHHFPDYSARQIGAQLKVTADNIDTLAGNESYAGLLGRGRLNMYRALTETGHSYVELLGPLQDPESYGEYQGGQNATLASRFENLLAPSGNISARLTSLSNWVVVQNPEISLGAMETGEIIANEAEPFLLQLQLGMPLNQRVFFMVEFFNAEGDYAGRQFFSLLFNVDFINLRVNQLSTTITSRGTLGFNYPSYSQGLGFVYRNGLNRIRAAGFMAGLNTNKVVDNLYGAASGTFNQFLVTVQAAELLEDPQEADVEVEGSFNDSDGGLSTIGLDVNYHLLAWQEAPRDKFLIIEYQLINQSGQDLSNFYAGFFANWLNNDPKNHRAAFDPVNRMGYAFSAEGGHYSGVSLLTEGEMRHYAFDNKGANGSINLSDGFTNFEKYNALRTNRNTAGIFDTDNEVSTLVSSGPHYLSAGDTLLVAFAILAGDHLMDLQASAEAAYDRYHGLDQVGIPSPLVSNSTQQIRRVYPNPFREGFTMELLSDFSGEAGVSLSTLEGRKVWQKKIHTEAGRLQEFRFHLSSLEPGSYVLQLENKLQKEQLILMRLE